MSPSWLEQYYGPKWLKVLNPEVVISGKSHAVVRLSSPGEVVHVLIQKNGKHSATAHEVLAIGVVDPVTFEQMKKRLQAVDS